MLEKCSRASSPRIAAAVPLEKGYGSSFNFEKWIRRGN
jgi:hypothetical protein